MRIKMVTDAVDLPATAPMRPFLHAACSREGTSIANLQFRRQQLNPDHSASYLYSAAPVVWRPHLGSMGNDGEIPALCAFFPGYRSTFTTNAHPAVHHVHNNTATGIRIVLHPDEPPLLNSAVAPIHVLRYLPRALIVQPDGGHLPPLASAPRLDLQPNQIVVAPKSKIFTPHSAIKPQAVHRFGFTIDLNYTEAD